MDTWVQSPLPVSWTILGTTGTSARRSHARRATSPSAGFALFPLHRCFAQREHRDVFPVHHVSPKVNPLVKARHPAAFGAAQISRQGPLKPILRTNPFPEITDLSCRHVLPASFCGPEAANLWDGMRLWVRHGVQMSLSCGFFSRAVGSASDTSNDKVHYQPTNSLSPSNLKTGKRLLKRKDSFFTQSCVSPADQSKPMLRRAEKPPLVTVT